MRSLDLAKSETERRTVDAGKDDEECFMGTEFQFGKLKSSGDEWWWWLHTSVNVLKATELYLSKWLRWYVLCYLYFTTIKKLGIKI